MLKGVPSLKITPRFLSPHISKPNFSYRALALSLPSTKSDSNWRHPQARATWINSLSKAVPSPRFQYFFLRAMPREPRWRTFLRFMNRKSELPATSPKPLGPTGNPIHWRILYSGFHLPRSLLLLPDSGGWIRLYNLYRNHNRPVRLKMQQHNSKHCRINCIELLSLPTGWLFGL